MLFFFYGSLLRGASNHGVIAGRTRLVGEDAVTGTLTDLGDYPGARPGEPGVIRGELYEAIDAGVPALLDAFEGEQYPRVPVRTLGGREAWIYACYNDGQAVPHGDWKAYCQAHGKTA